MRNTKRSRPTIGIIAGWQTYTGTIQSFLNHCYLGARAAAQALGCNLLIGCGVGSSYLGTDYTALPVTLPGVDFVPVGPWNTDGLILFPPLLIKGGAEYFQGLIDSGFPIIFAGDRETGPGVVVDNEGGMLQAVEHLVWHGHRRIAFITGHEQANGDSPARLRGYQHGLEQFGLSYDPGLVACGHHLYPGGYQAMLEILHRQKPFTAVIASNDESAVGAMDALRDSGLIVPQDVAVIGFDDRLEARAQVPLLTTIHHPMFELGYQAVERIHQIITGQSASNALLRIPTHLVVRESCGCLPGAERDDPLCPAKPVRPAPAAPQTLPESTDQAAQAIAANISQEMQCISRREVEYLCTRLLESVKHSLASGSADAFHLAFQQILEHVANTGDDLFAWQNAVSMIKDWVPTLLHSQPNALSADQIDDMLHQARIAISEVSRGQYSRVLVRRSEVTDRVGQMIARFFAAQTEEQVFEIFQQSLTPLGIQNAIVAFLEAEDSDTLAWSLLKTPFLTSPAQKHFATRQFPPPNLYPDDAPFQLIVLPLAMPEGLLGYAAFQTTDMEPLGTIVRQLAAALRSVRLYQEAVSARQVAEEANYLKSRFLSIVSHELRTPLNLIIGLSNMMLESSQPENTPEFQVNRKDLERIYIGAQHLESLIRDVLDLARSDVGQLKLVCEPLDLREVFGPVSLIGEQMARDKDLSWKAEIPPTLPLVRGDRTRLRQVVLNLVSNAIKFTAHGGITLSASVNDGKITISVRDTGLGIPVDEQRAIFDEFHQSRRTTARGYGGLGLGLSICKRLVEMHGGAIDVTSSGEEGAGSTFFFSLPVTDLPPAAQPEPLPTPAQRVLLLVKDPTGGEQVQNHLFRQGFQVDVHTLDQNGDWLHWLQPTAPDQVVLDLGLTAEHGWEILKTLKENPATREIPVLFYTIKDNADSGSVLDLNIMTKPVNTAELAEELVMRGLVEETERSAPPRPILVADDDPGILELHTRILESMAAGFRILQAHNGREALELIRKERPALVLLDLMMPEIDGFGVLEAMQADNSLRGIPTIVLTGQVLTEEDMERLNSGVVSVLSKGMFSTSETLDHVAAALSRRHRPGTETQRLVFKAMTYIHTHYKEDISRGDIAACVGVSERHLARCFQQEIGLAPITYLNRFRVKVAKMLLDGGKMNITDVAMEVGFSAGGYFTRVFRDEEGLSPREYLRRKCQESL